MPGFVSALDFLSIEITDDCISSELQITKKKIGYSSVMSGLVT